MKELIGTIPNESGFIAKYRKHQGWWRAFVLNQEEGSYWDERNKVSKKVCNRMLNGDTSGKNFLNPDILATVKQAVEIHKHDKSGIINEDRLYNNLLSSQPLAFNFFGYFKTNKEITLSFLKMLRPEITNVEDVVFEYSPKTKDHSAFDFGFIVRSNSRTGFMGFECKYTDSFSYKRKGSKVNYGDKLGDDEDKNYKDYLKIYKENQERFNSDYFNYVRNPNYNQLFRNELLAMQLKPAFDFVVTGLFCHHDDKETVNAGKDFRKLIGNAQNDFIMLTYLDYFEHMQKLDLTWEQRELVMMLWARYCGLNLSNSIIYERP